MQPVMQPEADVKQRYVQNNIESRLSMLETELNKIKEIILRNTGASEEETRNNGFELNQTKRGLWSSWLRCFRQRLSKSDIIRALFNRISNLLRDDVITSHNCVYIILYIVWDFHFKEVQHISMFFRDVYCLSGRFTIAGYNFAQSDLII